MRLPPFDLIQPESVADALDALASGDGETRVMGGGTALTPMLRLGLLRPARVVSLHRVAGLSAITGDAGGLRLGAMVSMAAIVRAPLVRGGWPLLAEAAGRVATPAIRTSATLGGNLAYAEAASDPAPALLCLEATVEIAGPDGERSLPLARFYTGFYETALRPGEIVTAVRVRQSPASALHGYVKFCPRSAEDKPLVGVAALVALHPDSGRCRDARLALGGVAPTPMRAPQAESALRDAPLDDRAIRAAADAAADEADPVSDLMGSRAYRRDMTRVWVRRLLTRLAEQRARSAPGVW
jgi:carbon-monoxide dehydrogenase medium subunit